MQQVNEITVLEHIFKHDSEQGAWFSEILRTTGGNDKPRISKILKTLRKVGLVESDKRWKMGTRKVLKLTRLGQELRNLVANLEQIRNYSNMLSHWNIRLYEGKIVYEGTPVHQMKNETLIEGEPQKLKELYDHWTNGLAFIHEQVDKHIFLSLIYWYGNLISKFKPKEKAIPIIQAVVVNQIKNELDIIMNKFGSKVSERHDVSLLGISYPIYEDIVKIFDNNYYLTSSEFLRNLLTKYIDSISGVVDSVTGLNYDEDYLHKLWIESNQVINNAKPSDILNEKIMKAKDNLELVKVI